MAEVRIRRLVQWRLSTLLIAITVVSCGLAFWLHLVAPYKNQSQALEQMDELQGHAEFALADPAWLGMVIGEDDFKRVVEYRANNRTVDDTNLAPISQLPFLERLYLSRSNVGDTAAKHIARLENLQRLSLWRTQISDKGLVAIAHCTNLLVLDLHETCVSDEGLEALRPLVNLRQLNLGGPICGPGLRYIAELPNLYRLDIRKTGVSFDQLGELAGSSVAYLRFSTRLPPSSAGHLANLPNLREFNAIIVEADDQSAKDICRCRQLESLQMAGVGLTDTSIQMISQLSRLKYLHLHGNLTDRSLQLIEGMRELKQVDIAGRFSIPQIQRLAQVRPNLSGTIKTICPVELYDRARRFRSLTVEPLVVTVRYGSNRFDRPVAVPQGGDLYMVVNWPATLSDAARLKPFCDRVRGIRLQNPLPLYEGYQRVYQRKWSLDGLDAFPSVRELSLHRVQSQDLERFADIDGLQQVVFTDERMCDDDLAQLRLPDSLQRLSITPSLVSATGLDSLAKSYPSLEIHASGPGSVFVDQLWQSKPVGQGAVNEIAKNPNIQDVRLHGIQAPLNLDPLAELDDLRSLELQVKSTHEPLWHLSKELPKVERLVLHSMGMTNREMTKLSRFPALKELRLGSSPISDSGLQYVVHTPDLRSLNLNCLSPNQMFRPVGPWLTGSGLKYLANCPKLESLQLDGTHIRDEYVLGLSRNAGLREISLSDTLIGDQACQHLSAIPSLRSLSLSRTKITDAGVAELANLKLLQFLDLNGTMVTDACLDELPKCRSLLSVNLRYTQVTDQGIAAFRKARGHVRVDK